MNPKDIMTIMNARNTFNRTHPRVEPFIKAVIEQGVQVGSIIEVKVVSPEGDSKVCNIRVQESDMELIKLLANRDKGEF